MLAASLHRVCKALTGARPLLLAPAPPAVRLTAGRMQTLCCSHKVPGAHVGVSPALLTFAPNCLFGAAHDCHPSHASQLRKCNAASPR